MTEATATAESAPQNAPPQPAPMDDDAAQLAELRGALSSPKDEPASEPAQGGDGAPAEGEATEGEKAPPAEPEKPKDGPARLMSKALEIQDKANARMEEARKLVSGIESRERTLAERESKLAEREKQDAAIGDAIRRDPLSAFGRLGFTPQDLARWCMEEPEQRDQRVKNEDRGREDSETKREVAELKARLQAQEDARAHQIEVDSRARFSDFVERHADQFPEISLEDPSELGAIFWELANEHYKNTKQVPTFEMVAAHLERAASSKRATREERRKKRSSPQASTSRSETQTPRENGQPASPGPRSPKTLSNAAAIERASGPRELSQEELDRECLTDLAKVWG